LSTTAGLTTSTSFSMGRLGGSSDEAAGAGESWLLPKKGLKKAALCHPRIPVGGCPDYFHVATPSTSFPLRRPTYCNNRIVEQHDLIVSGERPATRVRQGVTPYMIERQHGHFLRASPLPEAAGAMIANVEVRNGVLEVTLRKASATCAAAATAAGQRDSTPRSEKIASAAYHQLKESVE
jgi:Hsp20/alpha crystallin family